MDIVPYHMDDFLDDPDLPSMDDTARLLGELEQQCEGHSLLGTGLLGTEFGNPYVPVEAVLHPQPPSCDRLLDDQALLFDAFEAWQESQIVPAPFGPAAVQPYEPEEEIYGAFDTHPPLLPEPGPRELGVRPTRGRFVPRQMGSCTGIRRRDADKSANESERRLEVWCIRKGELVSEPDDDCETCEEGCPFAEDEAEDENK